ncbi:classical-complement-pathway C3/C5 convertase [Candidatus Endolissoclinum faulkneri L5]|uniref:Classical-complement-pathway C3/C5 convertase n=1 Tax=Candidatus Endolissoclinum faulkneri L5 TaxID=1401328 RepID=V9TUS1_9PROT|nr:SCO family protein [Candidatus Endolissoclinum faulkneri]AHC73438.1 classical-complement-pathway C3/C5 convertase [Candidatus Endolissoclinum faulkneri L5]
MSSRILFFIISLLAMTIIGTVTAGYHIWQARDGQINIGGSLRLIDHTGKQVSENTYKGTWQIVLFGYTFCPDICPTNLMVITKALNKLGPLADKVTPIFITIDPQRDTVKQLASYHEYFHPRFAMLTGTPQQIAKVAKDFRVYYNKTENEAGSEYLIDHSSITYLLDPKGNYVTYFSHGTNPDIMTETLRKYIH